MLISDYLTSEQRRQEKRDARVFLIMTIIGALVLFGLCIHTAEPASTSEEDMSRTPTVCSSPSGCGLNTLVLTY